MALVARGLAETREKAQALIVAGLVTVDGRRIDDGTPTADAGSIDAEDYAVLFALAELRAAQSEAADMEEVLEELRADNATFIVNLSWSSPHGYDQDGLIASGVMPLRRPTPRVSQTPSSGWTRMVAPGTVRTPDG